MQRTLRVALALTVSAAAATFTITAQGAPPALVAALEYDVSDADGCPDVEAFRSGVAHQLGRDPFRSTAARHVAVRIARKQGGFDASVRWSDTRGRWVGDRRLSSHRAECSEIAANVGFAVAVQIQLLAVLEADQPPQPEQTAPSNDSNPSDSSSSASSKASSGAAPSSDASSKASVDSVSNVGAPATTTTPEADAGTTPPGERRTTAPTRFRLSVGLGPSLAIGVAPHVAATGRVFVSGQLEWFSLELAFDATLPTTGSGPEGSAFSLNRYGGSSAACGHVAPFAGCLLATVGRLEARGLSVDIPATPSGTFVALGARIAARQDFGRYFASVRVDGLVMPATWSVTLTDAVAWTTPRVGTLLGLDFGADIF